MDSTAPRKRKRVRRKYKGQIVFWENGERVLLDDNRQNQNLQPSSESQNRHLEQGSKEYELDNAIIVSAGPTPYDECDNENIPYDNDNDHGNTTVDQYISPLDYDQNENAAPVEDAGDEYIAPYDEEMTYETSVPNPDILNSGQVSDSVSALQATPPLMSDSPHLVNEAQYYDRLRYQSENFDFIQRLYDGSPSSRLQVFALFDYLIQENGRLGLDNTVAGVRIVTVQKTIFRNDICTVITACDCTQPLSEFRSDILGQDFRQTDLARFVQESNISLCGQCTHTRAVLRYMYQEWSGDQPHRVDISNIADYLLAKLMDEPREVSIEPFRTSIHPRLYIRFDPKNSKFYSIHYRNKKWRCNGCPATAYCRHVAGAKLLNVDDGQTIEPTAAEDGMEEMEEEENDDEESWAEVPEIQGYSRKAYPVVPDERLQEILLHGCQRFFPVGSEPLVMGYNDAECVECVSTLQQMRPTPVIIFDRDFPVKAYVIDSLCPICKTMYPYDGYDKALLRHRTHIFSYELVSDFLDCCVVHGGSFDGYWNKLMDRYILRGYNPELVISWRHVVKIFRSVVYDFIRLLPLPAQKACCNGIPARAFYVN
ncbi:hypothetical protein BKA69DRAFT_251698 [Paraphysoderma sedebokerense]|nr:hypothetical protein BKA69DRAFT_251698 [Paraphysoderma sedebokerense]